MRPTPWCRRRRRAIRPSTVRNHNYREAPWDEFHKYADDLLASYDIPEPVSGH
jgi:hypothetical protein